MIGASNLNNLRHVDDTTLLAGSCCYRGISVPESSKTSNRGLTVHIKKDLVGAIENTGVKKLALDSKCKSSTTRYRFKQTRSLSNASA